MSDQQQIFNNDLYVFLRNLLHEFTNVNTHIKNGLIKIDYDKLATKFEVDVRTWERKMIYMLTITDNEVVNAILMLKTCNSDNTSKLTTTYEILESMISELKHIFMIHLCVLGGSPCYTRTDINSYKYKFLDTFREIVIFKYQNMFFHFF